MLYMLLVMMMMMMMMSDISSKPIRYSDICSRNVQQIINQLSVSSLFVMNSKIANAVSSPMPSASPMPAASILEDVKYKRSLFNLPPSEMTYPDYFQGDWNVNYVFDGAGFTSKIPFDQIARDPNVAGFRKYSVAYMTDIGKDVQTTMRFKKRSTDGLIVDDLEYNLKSMIETQQSDNNCKVFDFLYEPSKNPNRLGFKYSDNKGNGIIEIFVNDRKKNVEDNKFYSITSLRQSSVRRREDKDQNQQQQYAASQILCDYAIELSLTKTNDNEQNGLFRIFSFLNPQDSLYFISSDSPVAFFQYKISLRKQ